MRKLLTLTVCFFLLNNLLYSQAIDWSFNIGGIGEESGLAIKADGNSIYCGGYIDAEITENRCLSHDAYLYKVDDFGNHIWQKYFNSIGETGMSGIVDITVDNYHNIYALGFFSQDLKIGTDTLKNFSSYDIFILKLDAAGNYIWKKSVKGKGYDSPTAITTNGTNRLVLSCTFNDSLYFAGNTLLTKGQIDGAILEYDLNGNETKAFAIGGKSFEYVNDIALDVNGHYYIAGKFYDTLLVGTNSFISKGLGDAFALSLTSNGVYRWCRVVGGTSEECFNTIETKLTEVVLGGYVGKNAKIDNTTIITKGSFDAIILKTNYLNQSPNFITVGGKGFDLINALSISNMNSIFFVTGQFTDSLIFDGEYYKSKAKDCFTAAFDFNLNPKWFLHWASPNNSNAYAVSNSTANVYVAGDFIDSVNHYNQTLWATGSNDALFYKIENSLSVDLDENILLISRPYPNPFDDEIYFERGEREIISLTDLSGRCIEGTRIEGNKLITPSNLCGGVYFLTVLSNGQTISYKMIKG